ncbi:MAG: 3'(2'),5'-bisphosphate nucleotidase [Acidobacteria bacterium]|nr:3'(2'),5'-bisphosphate nucleotidase [Acidobacteriota bacterium]
MTFDLRIPEVRFALQAVKETTCLARQIQCEMNGDALAKEDRSPVTVADYVVQAVMGYLLATAFPDDPLLAEEDSSPLRAPQAGAVLAMVHQFVSRLRPSATPENILDWIDHGRGSPGERFWTLDPIDGTKGFLRGDQYVVALALVVSGQVQIGILGCPRLLIESGRASLLSGRGEASPDSGSLLVAVRDHGTWSTPLNRTEFQRLHVSCCSDPSQARLLRSYEDEHTNVRQINELVRVLEVAPPLVLMDSQAKYAVLAAGAADLLFRLTRNGYHERIWDQTAGSLIVEEAGGRLTDLEGCPLDFTTGRSLTRNKGLIASNGHLHLAALRAIKQVVQPDAADEPSVCS